MKRKCLAVGIILLFIGVAIAPSVNFTVVNASNNDKRENEISQKGLLFQTILDVANNREIQKIVFSSEMQGGVFFNTGMRFSVFIPQVITKNYLNSAYRIGLILTKTLGVSRLHSILERYQVRNQGMQKEVTAFIEKNVTLKAEIMQLSNSECDCENDNTIRLWSFPVLCGLLGLIFTCIAWIYMAFFMIWGNAPNFVQLLYEIILIIGKTLNCSYVP